MQSKEQIKELIKICSARVWLSKSRFALHSWVMGFNTNYQNQNLFNQGNGNSDPLPEEDEEADNYEQKNPNDRRESDPSVSLLQEVDQNIWCPIQLQK